MNRTFCSISACKNRYSASVNGMLEKSSTNQCSSQPLLRRQFQKEIRMPHILGIRPGIGLDYLPDNSGHLFRLLQNFLLVWFGLLHLLKLLQACRKENVKPLR